MKNNNELNSLQRQVLLHKATEKPFTSELVKEKRKGEFFCARCGKKLFDSKTKFDSGTGWPSFDEAVKGAITFKEDSSLGIQRIEAICTNCGGHLGHVFNDGPTKTGKRFCINGCTLNFKEKKTSRNSEFAYFSAGCFWHVQYEFDKINGVIKTKVGYINGNENKYPKPTYDEVCSGETEYAEAIEIEFDPKEIRYIDLIEIFWKIHNPTTLNQQGPDIGSQYRSSIFYKNLKQKKEALKSRANEQKKLKNKIFTQIVKAKKFFEAEEYHQKYFEKNPKNGFTCGI